VKTSLETPLCSSGGVEYEIRKK